MSENNVKKDVKQEQDTQALLAFLLQNKDKLENILSGEKVLIYPTGAKSTRTIFFSTELQDVLRDYCQASNSKIGEAVEAALIAFFSNINGYADRVKGILKGSVETVGVTGKNADGQT